MLLDGNYSESKTEDIKVLQNYILSCQTPNLFWAREGSRWKILNDSITLMHNRSVSENVIIARMECLSGSIEIDKEKLKTSGVSILVIIVRSRFNK